MISIPVLITFFVLSIPAGAWADVILSKCRTSRSFVFRIAFGGCALILTGMLASLIGGIFSLPVYAAALIYTLFIIVLSVSGIRVRKRNIPQKDDAAPKMTVGDITLIVISVIIVAALVCGIHAFRFENTRAIEQVGTATKVFDSGRLFVADPMMLFIGMMSKILITHPLIMIYTVLPATLITLYSLCCLEVIRCVTKGRYVYVAFIAVCAINLWGYQSEALIPATLLLSWFTLPVFVIHGLLGIIAVILIRYIQSRPTRKIIQRYEEDEDILEEWDMKKHKIINARNLAIALGVLAALLVLTVIVLNSKINRLYDATVNLQTDLNSRCSVYEFAPGGAETEAYLIKGENGKITVVGGGSSGNADELAAFISAYGTDIDKWYVYGDDEDNSGAMRTLTSNGSVNVNNVYVINREEIKTGE